MRLPKLDIAFVAELAVRVNHLCRCLEQILSGRAGALVCILPAAANSRTDFELFAGANARSAARNISRS